MIKTKSKLIFVRMLILGSLQAALGCCCAVS